MCYIDKKKGEGLAGVIRNKTWFKKSDLDAGKDKMKLAALYISVCLKFTSFVNFFKWNVLKIY